MGEEGKGKAKKGYLKKYHLDAKEKIKQSKSFRGYRGWGGVAIYNGYVCKIIKYEDLK